MEVEFVKGHGTENDFVLLPDLDDRLELAPEQVAWICDRRAGIGADGILRVVPAAAGSGADWFMDYRNADGSVAEMCGNGARVFARYLVAAGMAPPGTVAIGTRSGVRQARLAESGDVTVDLGSYELAGSDGIEVSTLQGTWPAMGICMPNPHLVAFVDDLSSIGDLRHPPVVRPREAAPGGANIEFVVQRPNGDVALRVHERGVGETRSCGTGAGAAAVAAALASGRLPEKGEVEVGVEVPGGSLSVTVLSDRRVELTGPAVLVATGRLDLAAAAGVSAAC